MNFNVDSRLLESVSVDKKTVLATNIASMPDCSGVDVNLKSEIVNRFPLVEYLLRTPFTQRVRSEIENGGVCKVHQDCDGKWVVELPRAIWTEVPADSAQEECCWTAPNFAKCGGNTPLNLLCLKSCESIMDALMNRIVSLGQDIEGIASRQEKLREVNRRIDRLWMAFFTAHTAILGHDNIYTNILKPFHGLAQVLENPAIATINGTNILSAFDSVACRLAVLGGSGSFTFAINPVTYQGLLNEIRPGQFGEYPAGWSRNGDTLTFHGIGFLEDKLVPVDLSTGTGEIWVLNNNVVGLYLATDLMPSEDFTRYDGDYAKARKEGCAEECVYYYNIGGAMANDANRLMRIVDVPLSGACTAAIGDLESLLVPQTLIPTA